MTVENRVESLERVSLPIDKQGHFLAGLSITLMLSVAGLPTISAASIAVLVGAAKEAFDWFHREHHIPDVYDFIATASGAAAGFGWILIFN